MPKYLIERTVPGAGQMNRAALGEIAAKSNEVLRDLGPDIQWIHSYVGDDKIVCGGFPVDTVLQVFSTIEPVTAELAV